MVIATALLAVLVCGSLVYCVLIVLASWRYRKADLQTASWVGEMPPMSILKPLCGHDEGLEENIRSFMEQDYPRFEVIFSVHRNDDSAAGIAQRIINEYAGRVKARLMVTGDSPIPNAKAFSLNRLVREAEHELLVMSDSDVRVDRNLLRHLAAEFQERGAGLITCPYRAIAGKSVWSRLEAVGMNTELLGGVLVARMLEGMKFALGCTVAVRRSVLESMGGFAYLQDFLAEDFVIGQRAAELGQVVLLSSYIIEHRIGSQGAKRNLSHRLRWARSTRRSRPLGYWGQIFTYPLPWALLLWAFNSAAWPIVVLTLVLRSAAAAASAVYALRDRSAGRELFLLPLQDLLGVIVWMGGFLGDTIVWRDRKCTVLRDGRLQVRPQA